MTLSTIAHNVQQSSVDFISFLRNRFDDDEAHSFFTSFALTLEGKNDEFCIDLDEAYEWLGYTLKQKAVDLIEKLDLMEGRDFNITRSGDNSRASKRGPKPVKYFLKPTAFKKMLLVAQTDASKKAAQYFIKIEEAIPEFYKQGGTAFTPPRASDWKALPISDYTARLTCKRPEDMIVSAGYNEDMSDPKAYFMRSGECTYPPGLVPEGAMVIDFGQTSDSRKRRADYERKTGVGEFLEHFPSPDPIRLERAIRRLAELEGRLVYGRRPDGTKTCEQAYVTSQTDYNGFAAKVYREQQKIIVEYCKLQAEREKRLTAEVELAKEREKTLQEKEKTQQFDRQVEISANEARKAEAQARISDNQVSLLRLRLQNRGVCGANTESADPPCFSFPPVGEELSDGVYERPSPSAIIVEEDMEGNEHDQYKDFIDMYIIADTDSQRCLQWSDLKETFRTWHDARWPNNKLKAKIPSTIKDYFTGKLGKFYDTTRGPNKDRCIGYFGWRLRSEFLKDVSESS